MWKKVAGMSRRTSDFNIKQNQIVPAKRAPQYIASLGAALGALAAGLTLSWSSAAGSNGKILAAEYNIPISPDEFSWIGSLTTLGSTAICISIGFVLDSIGSKHTMLLLVVPFTIGWLLIIFANSVLMFCIGRFITGISSGAFCVTVPIYTAEIAEHEIRGALGTYFQLFLSLGVLLSYILATFSTIKQLSIISAVVPIIFFGVFAFMPETPLYYLKKGDDDAARKSLFRLRGALYDVDNELKIKKDGLAELRQKNISYSSMFKSRVTVKGFIISYGLVIFQQFSGVNSILFYTSEIFLNAGSTLDAKYCTVIVGAIKVATLFVSFLVIDRLGRRILLLVSIIGLFITTFVLGVYFYLQEVKVNVSEISWLPLLCICVFSCVFNFGFGPIPWVMLGEIFDPAVKGVAASSAGVVNWISAFIVTKFYAGLKELINSSGTFWFYSGFCAVGIFFTYFIVPETKGKSLLQIQKELDRYI